MVEVGAGATLWGHAYFLADEVIEMTVFAGNSSQTLRRNFVGGRDAEYPAARRRLANEVALSKRVHDRGKGGRQWSIDRTAKLAFLLRGTDMADAKISGISPLFIVRNVPTALAFYRDRLGFDITFQGPHPDDIFFGIVRRDTATIMLKDIGVDPVPNYTRDIKQGWAWLDAYLYVIDPEPLAAEFSSRNIPFFRPLEGGDDGGRGFAVQDADGYVLYFGHPD